MFERFTSQARRAAVLSQEEARLLNHNYIGTEHLLLGILHQGSLEGVLPPALTLENVRQQVVEIIGKGRSAPNGHIPFTPRAKKALEQSLHVAIGFGHTFIALEHLMLALFQLSEEDNQAVAGQVLQRLDIDISGARTPLTAATIALPSLMAYAAREVPEASRTLLSEQWVIPTAAVKDFADWYQDQPRPIQDPRLMRFADPFLEASEAPHVPN